MYQYQYIFVRGCVLICCLLLVWYVVIIAVSQPSSVWSYSNENVITLVAANGSSVTEKALQPTSTEITSSPLLDLFNVQNRAGCKLVVCSIGNLGNQIWEYMSLFVVWKKFIKSSYTPYIQTSMWENLKVLFPKLSIQSTSDDICSNIENERIIPKNKSLSIYADWFTPSKDCKDIFLERYSSRYDEIIEYGVDKIREEMQYNEHLIWNSQEDLQRFKKKFKLQKKNVTFVGLHYRGTDYINHLSKNYGTYNPKIPNHQYYVKAMKRFKKEYKNLIFILITIDDIWLNRNLPFIKRQGNVVVNPYKDDRIRDLLILSNCNHTIINYGTFGVTAALLNGGVTFVYDIKLPLDHRGSTLAIGLAELLKDWHKLS